MILDLKRHGLTVSFSKLTKKNKKCNFKVLLLIEVKIEFKVENEKAK